MQEGLVIKSTGSWYEVQLPSGEKVNCRIRGKFRQQGIKTTNPVSVGDKVDIVQNKDGNVITHIHPRENVIVRRSSNLSKQSHILAANVDQAVLMVTLAAPKTHPLFIDRFLVAVESYSIPAVLFFNKTDLLTAKQEQELEKLMSVYRKIGYTCLATSVKEQVHIEEAYDLLQNKISIVAGNSGVGKSSLINAIEPGLNLKTASISSTHETGKHTTTFAEMHPLKNGGYIIDTPGIRGFGLFDIKKEDLSHFFPEIFKISHNCKFYNCTHVHEPGCAVIEAAKTGEIDEERYLNYLRILEDTNEKHR
jgi:ribosome biogenesis GTPase